MNRIFSIITAVVICMGLTDVVYGASLGDLLGGKKKEEQARLLEQKDQECQAAIRDKEQQYREVFDAYKDSEEVILGLREKNATLMEAYEKIVNDQSSITEQLNRLRRDSAHCEEIKSTHEQMTQENEAFLQENQELEEKIKTQKITLETLKSHIGELRGENEKLTVFLQQAQEDEGTKIKRIREDVRDEINDLKRANSSLQNENNTLSNLLKEFEKKSNILNQNVIETEQRADLLKSQLTALDRDYDALREENRYLEQEASEFPKRFTDLARHNRKLVKETAHMHYNMGVSFIKAKEYERAIKEFKKVLELDPEDPFANYNLGYIYAEHMVDRPEAIRYFKNYLTYAKDAKDADWVKKYILTWQTWYGKEKFK